MTYCRLYDGKWSWRGFFFGPYCPIYGFGGLIVAIFLYPISDKPLLLFGLSMLLTSLLEYLASYLIEKIFNTKLWDYSKYKFNINGRVCLLNAAEFGILGILLTYILQPNLEKLTILIPLNIICILDVIILVILSIDLTATLNSFFNFKEKLKILSELTEKIKTINNDKLSEHSIIKELSDLRQRLFFKLAGIGKRFIYAFPNLEFKNLNTQLQEFKQDIKNYQKEKSQKKE